MTKSGHASGGLEANVSNLPKENYAAFVDYVLTIADWFHVDQTNWKKRLALTAPLLGAGAIICQMDYSVIWRYFSWSNQTLAMIALWAAAVYLVRNGKSPWMCVVPAVLMSGVSVTYFFCAPECLGLLWTPLNISYTVYYPLSILLGIAAAALFLLLFLKKTARQRASAN